MLRQDLQQSHQQHQGKKYLVVKDPIARRYFRFTETQAAILDLLATPTDAATVAAAASAPGAATAPPAEAAAAPAAAVPAPAEHAEVALDQETFERVLAELLEQGTDRRVAEGRARRAAMVAARSKAEGGS